jgi:hypothetical protein
MGAIFCLGTFPIVELYPVLYHQLYPVPIYLTAWLLFGMALLMPALPLAMIPASRGIALKLVFSVLGAYLGLVQLRLWAFDEGRTIPAPLKAAVIALALGGCGWLIYRLRKVNWERGYRAAVLGSIMFALAPYLYSFTGGPGVKRVSADRLRVPGIENYVVLILDEFSTEFSRGLDEDLAAQGLHVMRAEVEKAGSRTLTAVPGMLTTLKMEAAGPCAPTRLCGGEEKVVDFRQLEVAEKRAHLAGFWHPYCQMRNWDECFEAEGTLVGASLGRVLLHGFWCEGYSRLDIFGYCRTLWLDGEVFDGMRHHLDEQIARSAFWKEGGFYLIHYPSPHPKGPAGRKQSLAEEYAANVEEARKVVRDLAGRLKERFGSNFVLAVTTDHPLRKDLWCKDPAYESPDCEKGPVLSERDVPLVVASPSEGVRGLRLPASNVGLLAAKP